MAGLAAWEERLGGAPGRSFWYARLSWALAAPPEPVLAVQPSHAASGPACATLLWRAVPCASFLVANLPQAFERLLMSRATLQRELDRPRDVFIRAYERSCQQDVAIRQALVSPVTFRLRHRQALATAIAAIVWAMPRTSASARLSFQPGRVSVE